jgi:hypothetical protein
MPVELGWKQDTSNSPMPLFFDLRQCPDPVGKTPVGFCGFASLDFAGPELTVTYQDENGTELLRESFVVEHSHLRHQLQGWLQHPDFHVQAPSA